MTSDTLVLSLLFRLIYGSADAPKRPNVVRLWQASERRHREAGDGVWLLIGQQFEDQYPGDDKSIRICQKD